MLMGRRTVMAVVGTCAVMIVGLLSVPATAAVPANARQVKAQVEATQKKANAAAARLSKATSELARAESEIAKLRTKAAANRKKIDDLQSRLKVYAVRQYTSGGQPTAEMAVGDAAQASRNRFLIRSVTVGSADELDAYRVARADETLAEDALDKRLAERRKVVSRLRGERGKIAGELARLASSLKALQAAAPRRASRSVSGSVVVTGAWTCPVQGARAFTNDYGDPRSGGRRHKGNDIFSPMGTPIVAPVAGTVSYRSGGLGGIAFYLSGVDGNTYYGAHMSRAGAAGSVAQGTVIGANGNSGNASGGPTHLHFEIRPGGGGPTNPYPTLRANC